MISKTQPSKGITGANYKGTEPDKCWLCSGNIRVKGGSINECFDGSQCEHILPAGTIQSLLVLPITKYNDKINKAIKKDNMQS